MAELKNIDGHFVETDYENALISFLEREGWQYMFGDNMPRTNRREVVYIDDLLQFLSSQHKDLEEVELRRIADSIRLVGEKSDFATLHKVYKYMIDGVSATNNRRECTLVSLIDFDNPSNNIFYFLFHLFF